MNKKFVGFGFGAIQGGLFLYEAFQSGNFDELTVAEVVPEVVTALRAGGGVYHVNVAEQDGISRHEVRGVAAWNPRDEADRQSLVEAVAAADEIATALPSVKFYGAGEPGSVVGILAEGLKLRHARDLDVRSIVYTAENHNHAAEILAEQVMRQLDGISAWAADHIQFLNTVVGKMSGVVTDADQIREQNLAELTDGAGRCLLVESFNRILISRITLPGVRKGIEVFEEKDDLLPFEEAKLYGHNATHALLGYLARLKGVRFMADTRDDAELVQLARAAFIEESGRALCRRHKGVDPLFTADGYTAYVDDLLTRMLNPHLRDAVERVVRDPERKLGWDDRLIGTMRVALEQEIEPLRYAMGAAAACRMLTEGKGQRGSPDQQVKKCLNSIWAPAKPMPDEAERIMEIVCRGDIQNFIS